jgi:flagellar biosynthetic protein FliQ
MTQDQSIQFLVQMLWTAGVVAGPVLLVMLAVGVVIGVVQVVTQLQEMTITFVPKLVAVFLVFVLLGPWMLGRLTGFATELWRGIRLIQ